LLSGILLEDNICTHRYKFPSKHCFGCILQILNKLYFHFYAVEDILRFLSRLSLTHKLYRNLLFNFQLLESVFCYEYLV
jgi:hypothetical protein